MRLGAEVSLHDCVAPQTSVCRVVDVDHMTAEELVELQSKADDDLPGAVR